MHPVRSWASVPDVFLMPGGFAIFLLWLEPPNAELKYRKYDLCHLGERLIYRKYKFAYPHLQPLVFNAITVKKARFTWDNFDSTD